MAYQAGILQEPSALVNSISSNIQKLTLLSNTHFILYTQNTIYYSDFSDESQRTQGTQQQGNQLAKETDRLMKTFTALPVGPDQRQRKIQKERLLNDFSNALTSFQKIQRVRASSRVSVSSFPYYYYYYIYMVSSCSDSQVQAQAEEITEEDLRLIQERELSIRQLESDITDINDIFKDLGMMVHEQGDMIDSIEANVENADVNVQNATQQLARAAEYQRSSRKKICILIIVLGVVAVIIGLIIWGALKN
uniref:Syntaxin-7 n=1 Tax=Labrus bergylta TaxID=56723 RepID=A0A3Q3GEN5_9LABR